MVKLKKNKKNKKKKKRLDVFPKFSNRVKQQIISLSQLRPSLALPLSLPFSLFLIFFFLFFFFFLLVYTGPKHLYRPKQPDFAGTASIFSDTKQGVYLYRCTNQYGIYWPYRLVRYGIDFLASTTHLKKA